MLIHVTAQYPLNSANCFSYHWSKHQEHKRACAESKKCIRTMNTDNEKRCTCATWTNLSATALPPTLQITLSKHLAFITNTSPFTTNSLLEDTWSDLPPELFLFSPRPLPPKAGILWLNPEAMQFNGLSTKIIVDSGKPLLSFTALTMEEETWVIIITEDPLAFTESGVGGEIWHWEAASWIFQNNEDQGDGWTKECHPLEC